MAWSGGQTAVVGEAFQYGDVVGRLPAGVLSQRYGGKRLLGVALLLASLCTALVPLSATAHFALVALLRFVAGATAVSTAHTHTHTRLTALFPGLPG